MNRALACDPNNLEVLLSLGVSYTNEFDRKNAVEFLRRWLATHPRYGPMMRDKMMPPESSQELSHAINLYKAAAASSPDDADVHAALGVLCNLARQYDDAVNAFRTALNINGKDYSLWNKLGATLANSSRSGEALDAYRRALESKPNYMRGWINMGISLANLGDYENSARYYVRALSLNAHSSSVWGYLRTSLICGGRVDLLPAVDENDIEALRRALPL
jgi:peroxin-5